MDCFIGIDVGTTNIKAAAYSEKGDLLAYHSECARIFHPQPDWSEFQPQEIWECVCNCLKAVTKLVGNNRVMSIGISSMAEAGIPLDEHGNVLYPLITWYDPRTKKQADNLEACVGRRNIYNHTGQIPSAKYGITKLMWIKDNLPEVFTGTRYWLSVEDYIIYRLTGEYATDYSVASRTMAFDINKLAWSKDILDAAGIDPAIFPRAYPGGTAIGKVAADVAEEIGLNEGVTVVTGGHDHACASIGVNILEDGVILNSMGTAEVSMIAVGKPVLNDETCNRYYSIYPHCGDKLYRVLTSNQSCGSSIEWFLNNLGKPLADEALQTSSDKYSIMERYADKSAATINGLFFFPFIRGSIESKNMRGVFVGIKDTHNLGHFSEAVIEGLCYELRQQISGYTQTFGNAFNKLRVVGGIAKSGYIMQTKANISNMTVEVPVNTESACFGAAILSAVGVGALTFSQISDMYQCGCLYRPVAAGCNDAAYAQYSKIRSYVKEIFDLCY